MLKGKSFFGVILILILIFMLIFPINLEATSQAGLDFSIAEILPENQIDESGFFNLLMEPGQEQTIVVRLWNNTDEDVVAIPTIATMTTSRVGSLLLSPSGREHDPSLVHAAEDVIATVERIVVPASGEIDLELHIRMPDEPLEGILAGGLTLSQERDDDPEFDGGGFGLHTRVEYAVAILLQTSVEHEQVMEFVMHDAGIEILYNQLALILDFQNPKPFFLNRLSFEVDITRVGDSEPLMTYRTPEQTIQMAPNSNMDYPIFLDMEVFTTGEYHVHVSAAARDGEDGTWEFEETIFLEWELEEELEEIIQTEMEEERSEMDYDYILSLLPWILIGLGVIVFFISGIVYIFKMKKAKKANQKVDKVLGDLAHQVMVERQEDEIERFMRERKGKKADGQKPEERIGKEQKVEEQKVEIQKSEEQSVGGQKDEGLKDEEEKAEEEKVEEQESEDQKAEGANESGNK